MWMGGCHMGWMWFGLPFFIVLAVVAWVLLTRRDKQGETETPEALLKRRFAKGEIDEETYNRMLEQLRK